MMKIKNILLSALLSVGIVATVQAELPKSVKIYQQKKIMLNAIKDKDCKKALKHMKTLEDLGANLPQSMEYAKGKCYLKLGRYSEAKRILEVYLGAVTEEDPYFDKAVEAYTKAEEALTPQARKARAIEKRRKARAIEKRRKDREAANPFFRYEKQFVSVTGDCFQMGSNSGDDDEKPVHRVCVSDYSIGKYEVTQGFWKAVMGNNPSKFKGDNHPVEKVSWNDVQQFINKLNQSSSYHYRLPTEAEWEYACRSGGRDQKYCGGDYLGSLAWYKDNSGKKTHSVGKKTANGLGLYDMSGNVWEWVQDWYDDDYYSSSPSRNPKGPSSGSRRVRRGGSWYSSASGSRTAFRSSFSPVFRGLNMGFRLARTSN
jgi:formylglycine-generating enzyme required for sulfatase activity